MASVGTATADFQIVFFTIIYRTTGVVLIACIRGAAPWCYIFKAKIQIH